MDYKLANYDKISKRVVNEDGKIEAIIMAYADGTWAAHDLNDKRITNVPLANTPRKAFNRWIERYGVV